MTTDEKIKQIKFLIETYEKSKVKETFFERLKGLYLLGEIENDIYAISKLLFNPSDKKIDKVHAKRTITTSSC